jgi:hypothetical protein
MADNPYRKYANSHPYLKHRDDLADEKWAAVIVHGIFQEIKMRFGEEAAVKMFAPYGRALNNKDRTRRKNTGLILQLYYMKKTNVSGLARELAGKGKHSAARIEALRQQIHRALINKHVIAEAGEVLDEAGDEGFDDFLRSMGISVL